MFFVVVFICFLLVHPNIKLMIINTFTDCLFLGGWHFSVTSFLQFCGPFLLFWVLFFFFYTNLFSTSALFCRFCIIFFVYAIIGCSSTHPSSSTLIFLLFVIGFFFFPFTTFYVLVSFTMPATIFSTTLSFSSVKSLSFSSILAWNDLAICVSWDVFYLKSFVFLFNSLYNFVIVHL